MSLTWLSIGSRPIVTSAVCLLKATMATLVDFVSSIEWEGRTGEFDTAVMELLRTNDISVHYGVSLIFCMNLHPHSSGGQSPPVRRDVQFHLAPAN